MELNLTSETKSCWIHATVEPAKHCSSTTFEKGLRHHLCHFCAFTLMKIFARFQVCSEVGSSPYLGSGWENMDHLSASHHDQLIKLKDLGFWTTERIQKKIIAKKAHPKFKII